MKRIFSLFSISKNLNILFLSNVLICFHYYLIIYINSTFLDGFFSETQISTLYIIGAVLNTALFLNVSRLLNKIGNYRLTIYMIVAEMASTFGLIVSKTPALIALYFVLHTVAIATLSFNLDIFLEATDNDDTKTGEIRGMYMTLGNFTIIICTLIVSFILSNHSYSYVYGLSFLFLIPFAYYIVKYFRKSVSPALEHIQIRETVVEYFRNKNLSNIFVCQFLLQLFYAFMVVYTPIYLSKYIGFGWTNIGTIFAIMLLPFIIFEIPVGDLADEKYGEKEFLTVGFIIMGLATIFISFITVKSLWIWATVLFITRIGASFVEITSDSYFFKHVDESKTNLISFYRVARPLSFIAGPIIAALSLQFIPFEYIFLIVGSLMIIGTKYSLALVDTR